MARPPAVPRVSARLPASLASCADPNGQLRCSGEGHECARQAKAASLRRVARAPSPSGDRLWCPPRLRACQDYLEP